MARRARRPKPKRVSKLRKVVLQTRTPPGPEYRRVCAIALALPGVEEASSYGTPGLKVKGRIMARLRTEAEGALALRCDFLDRQILLQADPNTFFLTDHYLNYPMVLVRLERVRRSELRDLIERAWRRVAPPKLVAEYDSRQQSPVTPPAPKRSPTKRKLTKRARKRAKRKRSQSKRKTADIPPS
jgi:hypothetical protein